MKHTIATILAILLLIGMGFFGFKAYKSAKSYEQLSYLLVDRHNVNELSTNKLKKIGDILSLGLYDGYKRSVAEEKELIDTQEFYKKRAEKFTIYSVSFAGGLLFLYFVLSLRLYTIVVSLSALIALAGGLLMPIMMMSIHKEVEYLGDVILTMESKGVLGSISKLFDNSNYVVGVALLLFSILLPLLKTLSMLFVAIFVKNKSLHGVVHLFKIIGKWSMADVFVVATFLVYLSASKGDMSRAEVQVGLYFFLLYVILSMIASLSADKMLRDSR